MASNDADSLQRTDKRMSVPRPLSVEALQAEVARLEAQIATLLADLTTLEEACTQMRRRALKGGKYAVPYREEGQEVRERQ